MWIACADELPEPTTLVLTSCGRKWAVAFWSGKTWRAAGVKKITVKHWMRIPPSSPPLRAKRCLPPLEELALVGAGKEGMEPHIAYRDKEGAPPSVWKRRPPAGRDERLEGVIYWLPLPALP